jgi:hypothetical protein
MDCCCNIHTFGKKSPSKIESDLGTTQLLKQYHLISKSKNRQIRFLQKVA